MKPHEKMQVMSEAIFSKFGNNILGGIATKACFSHQDGKLAGVKEMAKKSEKLMEYLQEEFDKPLHALVALQTIMISILSDMVDIQQIALDKECQANLQDGFNDNKYSVN